MVLDRESLPDSMAKAILIGVVRDIKTKETTTGKTVCNVRVQCGPSGTYTVVFWEDDAKNFEAQAGVGARVYVDGRLRNRKYTDAKTGTDKWVTEVTADSFQVLDEPPGF